MKLQCSLLALQLLVIHRHIQYMYSTYATIVHMSQVFGNHLALSNQKRQSIISINQQHYVFYNEYIATVGQCGCAAIN